MSLFPEIAPQLAARGYRPVPIKPGTKRPALSAWQNYQFSAADAAPWYQHCGTGILCGEVLGVDIDIPDVSIVGAMSKWVFQRFGRAPVRFGNKPKCLLLYRAAESGMHKAQTCEYRRGHASARVEVLATGQQFVAEAIHPGTGEPYEWHCGSPLSIDRESLPVLTPTDVAEIVARGAELLAAWGTPVKGSRGARGVQPLSDPIVEIPAASPIPNPLASHVGADDLTAGVERGPASRLEILETLAELAEHDQGDHENWFRVGAAIHHEMSGSAEGLEAFTAYSRCLTGFYGGEQAGENGCAAKWESFGRPGRKPITWGSIIYLMKALKEVQGQKQ
jgi:hypothetical protein